MLASSPEEQTLLIAIVNMDAPYFTGPTEVALMENPVHKVLIGNSSRLSGEGVSAVPVYPVRDMYAAIQMRSSRRKIV